MRQLQSNYNFMKHWADFQNLLIFITNRDKNFKIIETWKWNKFD